MLFSSATFLLAFLPLIVICYFLIPWRPAKNVLLLVASLIFYAWGEPVYVFLMLASIMINYCAAMAIDIAYKKEKKGHAKLSLVAALILDLGILGFYKYQGFFADNINALLGTSVPNLELTLPIGISFYTLQAVSYIIDAYRKSITVEKNPLYLGMYIAMFPQLIAGPIVRYSTIAEQIRNRKETLEGFTSGLRLFIIGLGKKVLLANTVAILATYVLEQTGTGLGAYGAWAGLLAFTFQIFFDFSGYSDMAIGLGKMFGFTYLRNFNYPYISKSITEFWRRWHISLSSFFRDYVYIPLGGNRTSKPRWALNMAVVWGLTGFWHGAAWNFILWGVYYGALLIGEKFLWGATLKRLPKIVQHVYTIFIFMIGWALFWVEDPTQLIDFIETLFGAHGFFGTLTVWEIQAWSYWPIFVICIVASTPVIPWLRHKLENRFTHATTSEAWEAAPQKGNEMPPPVALQLPATISTSAKICTTFVSVLIDIMLIGVLVLSVMSIVSGSFNPFIYFRF